MKVIRLIFCITLLSFIFGGRTEAFGAEKTATNGAALQTALSTAAPGDVIKLLGGVIYFPGTTSDKTVAFAVTKNVTISGGWNAGFTTRDISNPSILSGDYGVSASYNYTTAPISMSGLDDNAHQVLVWDVASASQGKIDGVVIIGGGGATTNSNATGITLVSGDLKIVNTTFKLNNRALYAGAGTKLALDSCTFTQNYSGTYGTAVALIGNVDATIINSIFENNGAAYSPIYLNNGAQLIASHSTFNDNLVTMQGAALVGVNGSTSQAKILFSTFANNKRSGLWTAGDMAVVLAYGGKAETYHCTFTGNMVQGEVLHARGAGSKITYGGNIFLGNTTNDTGVNAYVNVTEGGSYDNVGYNVLNSAGGGFTGIGNITLPPTNLQNYFVGGSYTSGNLYSALLVKPSTAYTKVVMPDGVNGTNLVVVPEATTKGWISSVWGSFTEHLTDQRNVGLQAIDSKYYAGATGVGAAGVSLDLTVFLQGPLRPNGVMTNYIQIGNSPEAFFDASRLPTTDPYGVGATCSNISNVASVGAIVDWIKVEIWSNVNMGAGTYTLKEQRALLLRTDGKIVDVDGSVPMFDPQTDPIRIIIKHRNHLGVMSNAISSLTSAQSYDFSASVSQAVAGLGAPMKSDGSKVCLWAGDLNRDATIDSFDLTIFSTSYSMMEEDAYLDSDLNMDGAVDSFDYSTMLDVYTKSLESVLLDF